MLLQATFLRGASALSNRKTENPVLAAELEQLQDDQLDTRCRRNGLSKKGGRDMQVCPPCIFPSRSCPDLEACHVFWCVQTSQPISVA